MHILVDTKVAFVSFVASWLWVLGFCFINYEIKSILPILFAFFLFLHAIVVVLSKSSYNLRQVAWRSYFLGFVFSMGMFLSLNASKYYLSAGLYLIVLALFHFGEYLSTALFNPTKLNLDAFILNHSPEYNGALLISWIEHGIWMYLHPDLKINYVLIFIGLVGCIIGDCFRKLAMYTAGTNFNHVVQHYKRDRHVLVTAGVYSLVRHPSYTGWFCWSVSTQVLLCNPVCFVGYVLATWKFFRDRIEYEEMTLLSFFGDQYVEYKHKVASGIPFVSGFQLDKTK